MPAGDDQSELRKKKKRRGAEGRRRDGMIVLQSANHWYIKAKFHWI